MYSCQESVSFLEHQSFVLEYITRSLGIPANLIRSSTKGEVRGMGVKLVIGGQPKDREIELRLVPHESSSGEFTVKVYENGQFVNRGRLCSFTLDGDKIVMRRHHSVNEQFVRLAAGKDYIHDITSMC
jgi:hypothetical protein